MQRTQRVLRVTNNAKRSPHKPQQAHKPSYLFLDFNNFWSPIFPQMVQTTMDLNSTNMETQPTETKGGSQVQVRFHTRQQRYAVTDTPILVPARLRRYGLSEIVNHLLASGTRRNLFSLLDKGLVLIFTHTFSQTRPF